MKKIGIVLGLMLILWPVLALGQGQRIGKWDSGSPSPFEIPEQWKSTLDDYRNKWIRLTDLEFSGLHWNQGIVVYINQSHKTFVNNYVEYLKILEGLDEDEDCDPGERYLEDEDECISVFRFFPKGTIVLKENYLLHEGVPQQPLTVTMMAKEANDDENPENNWKYIQFDKDGKILISGKASDPAVQSNCAECHQNMMDRDYIFSTFYSPARSGLPKPQKEDN